MARVRYVLCILGVTKIWFFVLVTCQVIIWVKYDIIFRFPHVLDLFQRVVSPLIRFSPAMHHLCKSAIGVV